MSDKTIAFRKTREFSKDKYEVCGADIELEYCSKESFEKDKICEKCGTKYTAYGIMGSIMGCPKCNLGEKVKNSNKIL